jgi:hypothetical protein
MKIIKYILGALRSGSSIAAQRRPIQRTPTTNDQIRKGISLNSKCAVWVARHITVDIQRDRRGIGIGRNIHIRNIGVPETIESQYGSIAMDLRRRLPGTDDAATVQCTDRPGVIAELAVPCRDENRRVGRWITRAMLRPVRAKGEIGCLLQCSVIDLLRQRRDERIDGLRCRQSAIGIRERVDAAVTNRALRPNVDVIVRRHAKRWRHMQKKRGERKPS